VADRVTLDQSTISEYLPQLREGGFSSLNTDQFVYYTFYARINEQVRNRWVQNLQQFFANTSPQELNRLSTRNQVTEIEILLDQKGNYYRTIYHRKSQSNAIDQAGAFAFENAAPFINPPSEMIEKDGYIHLFYQLNVLTRPQYVASPK
jgi:hypothetical protein